MLKLSDRNNESGRVQHDFWNMKEVCYENDYEMVRLKI